jgi:predicted anti-sigma-YlaC factor YlaD
MAGGRYTYPCAEIRALLSEQLDDELSEFGAEAVRAHLGDCPDCRAFAADAERVAGLLRTAALEAAPPFVLRTYRQPTRVARRLRLATAAAAAVACSAALGAGVGKLTHQGAAPPATALAAAAGGKLSVPQTQEPYIEQQLLAMLVHPHSLQGRVIAT